MSISSNTSLKSRAAMCGVLGVAALGLIGVGAALPATAMATPATHAPAAAAGQVVKTIHVGEDPDSVAISPNGDYAYVANQWDGHNGSVSVIRTSDNAVVKTIAMKEPTKYNTHVGEVAFNPNGKFVYVLAHGRDLSAVDVIRTSDNKVVNKIDVAGWPRSIAVTENGEYAYVSSGNGSVSKIDTSENKVVKRIDIPIRDSHTSQIVIRPNSNYVYVQENKFSAATNFYAINMSTNRLDKAKTIHVAAREGGFAFKSNGNRMYATDWCSNDNYGSSVREFDVSTKLPVKTINVGDGPSSITMAPDGEYAYVTNMLSNSVSMIKTADNKLVQTIDVGTEPRSVAITPNGEHAYTANYASNTVSVFDTGATPGH